MHEAAPRTELDESSLARDRGVLSRRLDRPLSSVWCVIGWITSTAVFVGIIRLLGGPAQGDAAESVYSTWAVQHGALSCVYPAAHAFSGPAIARPGPPIPPVWPLISGAVAAIVHVGGGVPYPVGPDLGAHCAVAPVAVFRWAINAHALSSTLRISYLCWIVLMAGAVMVLRASGRGRCGWEPAMLLAMACTPAVLEPVLIFFHPQDVVAMGLVLGSLACATRSKWTWAGILMGLAICTQQFALLALAPVCFIVPAASRVRAAAGLVATVAAVDGGALALTAGRAIGAELIGSGNTKSIGGSVLWELHLSDGPLVAVSRVLPIALAGLLGLYVARRLGGAARDPVVLCSLVAVGFGLRLVFEQQIFGYYYMALSVAVIAIDAMRRQFRGETLAWIALVTLAFNPIPWGLNPNAEPWGYVARADLPLAVFCAGLLIVSVAAVRRRLRWYQPAWLVAVAAVFITLPPWDTMPLRRTLPAWLLQLVIVPLGIALVWRPLREHLDAARATTSARVPASDAVGADGAGAATTATAR